jgi:hypothetical protein
MLVNISEIKKRVEEVLHARSIISFLNEDHPVFQERRRPRRTSRARFSPRSRRFSAISKPPSSPVIWRNRRSEALPFMPTALTDENHWLEFSAARQTMSPHLSAAGGTSSSSGSRTRRTATAIIIAPASPFAATSQKAGPGTKR